MMGSCVNEEYSADKFTAQMDMRNLPSKCSYDSTQLVNDKNYGKKLSYFQGDTSEPLCYDTIGQTLLNTAIKYPHRTAIVHSKIRSLTFEQVLDQVETLAAALLSFGLKSGDHVAIWGFNSMEWYLSFLAITQAGLVAVNLNPFYEAPELKSCLLKAEVKALIMDENLNDRDFYNILKRAIPKIEDYDYKRQIKSETIPSLQSVVIISTHEYRGTFKWIDLLTMPTVEQKTAIRELQSKINVFDTCNLQFTSGTTNAPKGVMSTHFGIVNNARFTGKYLNLFEKEHRICLPVPFFHTLGTVGGLTATVYFGVTLIIPHVKFSSNRTVDCIINDRCTIVYGTPTMYIDILTILTQRAEQEQNTTLKMSSLERFFSAGAICSPEVILKLKRYFPGVKFSSGYGMTEILSPFMSRPDDYEDIILSTVGRIMDHQEVKIINKAGDTVPMGVSGELCCKGYSLMKGYYGDAEKTRLAFLQDGWFRTGDRFVFLENGYAQIIGRIKDTIIRGGENIEPKEIEQILMTHPEIVNAQVYGIPCQRLGEMVAACIVRVDKSNLCQKDVQNYCQQKIARYKIPEYVIFLNELPKTASGKIQKYKLRQITEEIIGKNLKQK